MKNLTQMDTLTNIEENSDTLNLSQQTIEYLNVASGVTGVAYFLLFGCSLLPQVVINYRR